MKNARYTILAVFMGILFLGNAFAQEVGDYRSLTTGVWSAAATWETFDGANWIAAGSAPTGAETITADGQDTVYVDIPVTVTGYVMVTDTALIEIGDGTLTFEDGSTYEHARDAGKVPTATWETGSTALFTGITSKAPSNRGQDYYNLTLNTPDLSSNLDMNLYEKTIYGDLTVLNTGGQRWRLVGSDSGTVTIMGDVTLEAGSFETQGTSSPTVVEVLHYGNINVTGGTFGISRGSQGSGMGTTTWYLFEGDFSMSNAELRNSNPAPGHAKFVFAKGDTQQITFENVDYNGDIHYEVSDTTTLRITEDFDVNGLLVNKGEIDALGTLTFIDDGAVYEHARNGGSVPSAVWEEGSTALFTGITGNAPSDRGQDYYNLTLNTPDLSSNLDMNLYEKTIYGDLTVLNTGSQRWRLVGSNSGTVTIMGDVIVEDGSFETLGTGNPTVVEVHHYGNVVVTGGTFAISRGSQGDGAGSTRWYMHEGNFSISNATTRNTNTTNAWFVFDKDTTQTISLSGVSYGSGGLPIKVASGTTLDFGISELGGNGLFTLNAGATLATAHTGGVDSTLQTTGEVVLSDSANFTFNGTEAQVTGVLMPDTVNGLTIDNEAGVILSQETTINGVLRLVTGEFDNTIPFTLGPNGSISYEGGSLLIPVSIVEQSLEIPTEFAMFQNYPNPFNPSTTIRYDVPERAQVTVKIYDLMGREVAELVNDQHTAGVYTIVWNAHDFASGVYYYRMTAGDFVSVRKLVLMK